MLKEIKDAFKNQGPGDWPIPISVDGSLAVRRVEFTESLKGEFNSNSNGTDPA